MAARVLFQRRALAPLATIALSGMVLAPSTIYAEAPIEFKRKPIYDDTDFPSTIPSPLTPPKAPSAAPVDEETKPKKLTPTDRLAIQIGNARLFLYQYAVKAEDAVNSTMDSAFDLEQSFTKTIADLAPSRESGERLMPGAIYVLVAAMAGSIVTRNRSIILRSTLPLAVGIGAGWSVLPVTMRNISDLVWKYEERVPVVAQAHLSLRNSLEKSVSFVKVHKDIGARYVDDKVTDTREALEGWVRKGK
ncbi:unnamed protein product [Clonostachys rosea f. rosea IK726]|uniref:MICOS complex subunit n=3 Tax=Bionectria ochroleuca TaxID=29856 RepID=A0A0B7JK46_BIOOC|nr:unnamed protein product [Clonostachys rosea f. rosea IK726]